VWNNQPLDCFPAVQAASRYHQGRPVVLEAGADVFAPLDALPQLIAARIRAALRHA
jgi:hypothetical protein